MRLVIRSETFYRKPGSWLWQLITANNGVTIEDEAGRPRYTAIHGRGTYPLFYDWTVRDADGIIGAKIQEDAQKRRTGTKKWLGLFEYKTPKPEFIVSSDEGAELARVQAIRDPDGWPWTLAYTLQFRDSEYRLHEGRTAWWPPYSNRWLVRCGNDRVAESDRLGWKGATLQRMQFDVTSEEHVWPVLLLVLSAWGREQAIRDSSGP